MKVFALIAVLAFVIPTCAHAKCDAGTKTLFSCTTAKNKQIELCDAGKTIQYSFGKPGAKPEITVSVPRDQATTTQWGGAGDITNSVEIPNGATVYSVYSSIHRDPNDPHPKSAGVNVLTNGNGQVAASVQCSVQSVDHGLIDNLDGVKLKPTP